MFPLNALYSLSSVADHFWLPQKDCMRSLNAWFYSSSDCVADQDHYTTIRRLGLKAQEILTTTPYSLKTYLFVSPTASMSRMLDASSPCDW